MERDSARSDATTLLLQDLGVRNKRAILDTNTVMNGCFLPYGYAARAIRILRDANIPYFISDSIEYEIRDVIRKEKLSSGLSFDPNEIVRQYLQEIRALRLPPSPYLMSGHVNKSDRHLYSSSQDRGAFILSGDARLVRECRASLVDAVIPSEVVYLWGLRRGLQLNDMIDVLPPTSEACNIFARVSPASGANVVSDGEWILCEIGGVARLSYDLRRRRWVFWLACGVVVEIAAAMRDEEEWTVCASYHFIKENLQGILRLFVKSSRGVDMCKNERTFKKFKSFHPTGISIGHGLNMESRISSLLQQITIGPQPMKADRWRALCSTRFGMPSPMDDDGLRVALQELERSATPSLSTSS